MLWFVCATSPPITLSAVPMPSPAPQGRRLQVPLLLVTLAPLGVCGVGVAVHEGEGSSGGKLAVGAVGM